MVLLAGAFAGQRSYHRQARPDRGNRVPPLHQPAREGWLVSGPHDRHVAHGPRGSASSTARCHYRVRKSGRPDLRQSGHDLATREFLYHRLGLGVSGHRDPLTGGLRVGVSQMVLPTSPEDLGLGAERQGEAVDPGDLHLHHRAHLHPDRRHRRLPTPHGRHSALGGGHHLLAVCLGLSEKGR